MIVPVILNYNFSFKKKYEGLWIFYKYLDFCNKNDTCIIGRECYYKNPKIYEKSWDLNPNVLKMYDYEYPSIDFLKYNSNFMINEKIEDEMVNDGIDWSYLLKNRYKKLEKLINDSLDKIEQLKKNKINIIITWYPFESLNYICRKRKIKLLSVEFSGIRKEWYNLTLSSISLQNKYNSYLDVKRINDMDFSDKLIFTREELIVLFSYKNDLLDNLKILKSAPIYEIGYALGLDNDPYEKAFCKMQQNDVIDKLKEIYNEHKLLFRLHPQLKAKITGNIDDSKSAREFVSKCDKVIIQVSNVGYEAMLYGRKVSCLNKDFLVSLNKENSLINLNDSIITLEELNFITFGLYTLYENLFNTKFLINFAYKNIDINDFYVSNINQILKKYNLDYNVLKNIFGKKRMEYILKQVHGLRKEEIKKIEELHYGKSFYDEKIFLINEIEKLKDKVQKQIVEINNLRHESMKKSKEINYLSEKAGTYFCRINEICNSKSWILLEKIRKIRNKIIGRN